MGLFDKLEMISIVNKFVLQLLISKITKCFRIHGGILSEPAWNEGLILARNLRHASGVILI